MDKKIRATSFLVALCYNASLVYRNLIFLDYNELKASIDFPSVVDNALHGYSYIIYPTIKHTAKTNRVLKHC